MTVGPSLAASPEPFAHRRNVASLGLFYRCYFGTCSSELTRLASLSCSGERTTHYSDRLHDISLTIPRPPFQGCLCQQFLYSHS